MERAPATAGELHAWIRRALGVDVAREAIMEGHSAPFDYVAHSFFEGRVPGKPAGAPDCVVWASRGGGKTFLGALATLLDMVFKPGIEVRVLGGSLEQSRRMHAHLRRFFDEGKHPWAAGLLGGRITERRIGLRNGSEVELLAQSQTSVRGTRVQKLRCDEVELFDREVWEAAQLATKSKRCGGVEVAGSVECLSTMHVPFGLMHDLVREAREGRRTLVKWGVVDVLGECGEEHRCQGSRGVACALWEECQGRAKGRVGGHLAVSDALTLKGRVSLPTWRSEMLCLAPKRTDAVLPEFDARVHVFAGEPGAVGELTWIGGMDFGFRAPTVVLFACVDLEGTVFVVDERSEAGVVLAEHVEAVRAGRGRGAAWPKLAWIGVDPAGRARSGQTGKSHIQVMKEAGLVVRQRVLGVQRGLELVRARLCPAGGTARARLFVHERCRTLIESLERYHYPADDPESMDPVKGDGFDHAVDALRYMIQNLDSPVRVVHRSYLG